MEVEEIRVLESKLIFLITIRRQKFQHERWVIGNFCEFFTEV